MIIPQYTLSFALTKLFLLHNHKPYSPLQTFTSLFSFFFCSSLIVLFLYRISFQYYDTCFKLFCYGSLSFRPCINTLFLYSSLLCNFSLFLTTINIYFLHFWPFDSIDILLFSNSVTQPQDSTLVLAFTWNLCFAFEIFILNILHSIILFSKDYQY